MESEIFADGFLGALLGRIYSGRIFLAIGLSLYVFYLLGLRLLLTYRIRNRYTEIPCLPRHWLWGNLVNAGEKLNPSIIRHPDYGFEEIWEQCGRPSAFLLDMAPVERAYIIIAHPEAAELVVQKSQMYKYSVTKSDTYHALTPLIGSESILTKEGEEWESLRKRFSHGFQPKHLHSLAPSIVSMTGTFLDRMRVLAETGETFSLSTYAKDLTTDIITQIALETDLKAQSTPEGTGEKGLFGALTASRRISELIDQSGGGLNPLYMLNFVRPAKSMFYEYVFDKKLTAIVKEKFRSGRQVTEKLASRSIAQLALKDLKVTNDLIKNTVHQIKTFLFAGQDTTATLVQWMCFELSKAQRGDDPQYAEIMRRLREEHDAVFSASSPWSALDVLSRPGEAESILGSKLPYTTAFVKETLRLHPPAGTARILPFATDRAQPLTAPMAVTVNGISCPIDGLRIYPCHWLIHRNPAVWGDDALVFRPERWLDETYVRSLPPGAWRPFERGPRNCIGQELAMIEGRVVLCAVARGLSWEKVGLDGRNGEEEVFSKHEVTSVPVDGMKMRVRLTDQSESVL